MSQYVHRHSYVPCAVSRTGTSIDDLIRPGLRLAYPLPSEEASGDARFQRLLDLLAERVSGQGRFSQAGA